MGNLKKNLNNMSHLLAPQIVILREGTDDHEGRGQIISNINACQAVVDVIKTTLGPRGMDKLIHSGRSVTISNDGATLIGLLDIVHPAAKTLVDIAQSQDNEVGDGTTSVVLTAGELLKNAKQFIEEGMHSQIIIKGFREAQAICCERIREISVKMTDEDPAAQRLVLERCAMTSLNSKIISRYREFFGAMVVDAVQAIDGYNNKQDIGIKKITGGSATDSKLENPEDFQKIVDAEWKIIYDKLDKIHATGAKVVLSRLPIGDLATQYFADRGVFCAGRCPLDDLDRTAKATGGVTQTTTNGISEKILGTCEKFEEVQIGNERYNMFTGCPAAKTVTIILRGGASQYIEEAERSLNDALMIVIRAVKARAVVAGGGAIEMELSRHLKE